MSRYNPHGILGSMAGVSEVLRHAIRVEYGYVLGVIGLFVLFLMMGLLLLVERKSSGANDWNGVGFALILLYVRMGVVSVTGFLAGIVHPIRILVKLHDAFSDIKSLPLMVGTYLLTLLPILFYLGYLTLEFFGNAISNYFYKKNTGPVRGLTYGKYQ